jgi:molybdate transport system substrate-binding protein
LRAVLAGALSVVSGPTTGHAAEPLRVFAAASLVSVFTEIADHYEARNPGQEVVTNFAGSQQLATQMELGAAADVFASADVRWMDHARDKALLAGSPRVFARNRLVVVVAHRTPAAIDSLADLARPGVKLVLAADAVPVGRYSRQALRNLGSDPAYGSDYPARVLANLVSEEENVRAVLAKVQLDEADAGIVYRSDAAAAAGKVGVLEIPDPHNLIAGYPIAVVKSARDAGGAQRFVDLVLSPEGQHLLSAHGFTPVTEP